MDDEQLAGLADPDRAHQVVGGLLDELATSSTGLHDLDSRVRHELQTVGTRNDRGTDLLRAAADAISYMLIEAESKIVFAPWLELADGSAMPIRLDDQQDSVVNDWHLLFSNTSHPAWQSRLGHLIVASDRIVSGKDRVELAKLSITRYLALPNGWGSGLDAYDNLRSALALARQFRLREAVEDVLAKALTATDEALGGVHPKPGVVLRLTQLLIDQKSDSAAVDARLQKARTCFDGDLHNTDATIAQQIMLASSPDMKAELWAERVHLWLDGADATEGVVRAAHLKRAVEHATTSGNSDLRAEATTRLQALTLDDLQLQGIQTSLILHGEQIAEEIRPITEASSWSEALDHFVRMGPITGNYADNVQTIQEQSKSFISHLIPRTTFGGDGLPRFTANSDEEREEYNVTLHESFLLQMRRNIVAEALLRLPQHHGLPAEEDLAAHFARNPIVDSRLARALARSFLRWWQGDYEGAAFTAAPRVESLARNLLLALDASIYRLQRQQSPGQYPGLGALLSTLRTKGLSDNWYRFIHCVLTNPVGWNLRNEISHGLIDDIDFVTSAMILQCAALLALLTPGSGSAATADDTGAAADTTDPPNGPSDGSA